MVTLIAVDLSFSGVCEFEDEEGNPRMDFDYFGYLRNPDDYRRIRSTGVLNMDDEDVCANIPYSAMFSLTCVIATWLTKEFSDLILHLQVDYYESLHQWGIEGPVI